ncbi:MAG TPA: hypothetical protein VN894_06080 [Polyangiaceae bacterium]|nr:hypothetical protein [Polyangiaceae bacterium]
MRWTTPTFDEVKMDAEIGSYQEDTDPPRDAPVASEHDQQADG